MAVLCALVPVFLTTLGFAAGAVLRLGSVGTPLLAAGAASVSAVLGIIAMARAAPLLADFGLRDPRAARAVGWYLPVAVTPLLVALGSGHIEHGASAVALTFLAVAAAVNEEVWFRGLVLTALLNRGVRQAVLGSSALFGVLHLANLAGGVPLAHALEQLTFATLFGLVAAELCVVTRSLWPVVAWHASWDLVAYLGGDSYDTRALVVVALASAVLAGYAVVLWGRLDAPTRSS